MKKNNQFVIVKVSDTSDCPPILPVDLEMSINGIHIEMHTLGPDALRNITNALDSDSRAAVHIMNSPVFSKEARALAERDIDMELKLLDFFA